MIIDFFDHKKRGSEERLKILQQVTDSDFTESYMNFSEDYFDNPQLRVGYGGYKYDGRYQKVAEKMISHYGLVKGMSVLEIGCAKAFLLVEFFKQGLEVRGLDYSEYALAMAHPDVKQFLCHGSMDNLPYVDESFDFVIVKEVLPHIPRNILEKSIRECIRVSKGKLFFEIQCGRTPLELDYMKKWDKTHLVIETPQWWDKFLEDLHYPGDVHYNILVSESPL